MLHEENLDQFCGKRDSILLRVCVLPKAHDGECEDVSCRKIFLPKHNHVSDPTIFSFPKDFKAGVPVYLSQREIDRFQLIMEKDITELSDSKNI